VTFDATAGPQAGGFFCRPAGCHWRLVRQCRHLWSV